MKRSLVAAAALAVLLTASTGCDSLRIRVIFKEGHNYYKAQKYEEAVKEYKKVLAIEPNNWLAHYQIAMSSLAMYHPGSEHPKDKQASADAIDHLEKLLAMKSSDEDRTKVVKYYLAMLAAVKQDDKAAAFLEKELASKPDNIDLIKQLATVYAGKGDFQNAVKYFEKRAQLEPKIKEAWYTLGVAYWERSYDKDGRMGITDDERSAVLIPKGVAALKKAIEVEPEYFEALTYLNLIYREQQKVMQRAGRIDEANQAVETATKYLKEAMRVRNKQLKEQKKG